ncbi:MAG TPA: c-type cytochrome [Bryobacteraceae bacterium]|jgi:cytochrome c2|nr:c-type cytochrome [Bryobacteraceae bacterium]
MSMLRITIAGALATAALWAAGPIAGDAQRGEQLFQSERCVQCHSFQGKGGTVAPDLSKRIDRDYTPAVMASLMWNHAPAMWSAMKSEGIVKSQMTPEIAADLFAYFVSARFFDRPGDAGRGKQLFAGRHCADCHGLTAPIAGGGPAVVNWGSLVNPLALAEQMWNHGQAMRAAYAQKKFAWEPLTGQELSDVLVYLQNLPETRGLPRHFEFPPSQNGAELFQAKGCTGCHKGAMAMDKLLKNQTLTDIAAAMWNHQPEMKQPPITLSPGDMQQLIGYIWTQQYFTGAGSAERGSKVFAEKNCATCHNDPASGAPKLGKDQSDITMVAALWEHGPRMLDLMKSKNIAWPRFTAREMDDLIAYLNR